MIVAVIVLGLVAAVLLGACFKLYGAARPDVELAERLRSMEVELALAEERVRQAETRCEELRADAAAQVGALRADYDGRMRALREDCDVRIRQERDAMGERFKALAADVLRANSCELDRRSRLSLEAALSPMKESLEAFTRGYRECYDIENRDRISLREEIRSLHELNTRVGAEASRLTSALKGNTGVQGRWGEMMLVNILEHSGLQEGRWLVTQESTTDTEGTVRPDAVIHCPRERDIIIDSKVSLTAYLRMLECGEPEERKKLARQHVQSVESHIRELRDKEYQRRIGARKGDFVLMFMPHEGAYLEAMNASPDLWQRAYDSHVVIVSPTHLVTVVRLVEQMWQTEDQSVNSQKIADMGRTMIDSVTAFLKDMAAVGESIEKVQKAYDSAVKRLSTGNNNVLRVAGRLQELGIRSSKPMPKRFAEELPEAEAPSEGDGEGQASR